MGDADHALGLDLNADEHAVQRNATHERTGGVDGVENPSDGSTRVGLPVLLAKDRVLGESLLDLSSDQLFGFTICDSNGRPVRLRVVIHETAEVPECKRASFLGDGGGELQKLAHMIRRPHGAFQ